MSRILYKFIKQDEKLNEQIIQEDRAAVSLYPFFWFLNSQGSVTIIQEDASIITLIPAWVKGVGK